MINDIKDIFWKLFLVVYLIAISFHVAEMDFGNIWSFILITGGFLIALIAHRKAHVLSLLFLLAHMVIEAIEFSAHSNEYSNVIIFWFLVHVLMDVIFLWGETKRHFPNAKRPLFLSSMVAIASIYVFIPKYIQTFTEHASHDDSLMVYFVVGGVLGCILSHLIPHKHSDQK